LHEVTNHILFRTGIDYPDGRRLTGVIKPQANPLNLGQLILNFPGMMPAIGLTVAHK
jgi:hypothetical protein